MVCKGSRLVKSDSDGWSKGSFEHDAEHAHIETRLLPKPCQQGGSRRDWLLFLLTLVGERVVRWLRMDGAAR